MKKTFILIALGLFSLSISAQTTYTRNSSGQLVSLTTPVAQPRLTGDVITIKDVNYPVYVTSKGRFFIVKTSKKTGKQYKQYITIE